MSSASVADDRRGSDNWTGWPEYNGANKDVVDAHLTRTRTTRDLAALRVLIDKSTFEPSGFAAAGVAELILSYAIDLARHPLTLNDKPFEVAMSYGLYSRYMPLGANVQIDVDDELQRVRIRSQPKASITDQSTNREHVAVAAAPEGDNCAVIQSRYRTKRDRTGRSPSLCTVSGEDRKRVVDHNRKRVVDYKQKCTQVGYNFPRSFEYYRMWSAVTQSRDGKFNSDEKSAVLFEKANGDFVILAKHIIGISKTKSRYDSCGLLSAFVDEPLHEPVGEPIQQVTCFVYVEARHAYVIQTASATASYTMILNCYGWKSCVPDLIKEETPNTFVTIPRCVEDRDRNEKVLSSRGQYTSWSPSGPSTKWSPIDGDSQP